MNPTQAQIEAAVEAVRKAWLQRGVGPKALAEAALAAAAELGKQGDIERLLDANRRMHDDINDMKPKIEAATIERCAQVAEGYNWENQQEVQWKIAAAIRALKDKP